MNLTGVFSALSYLNYAKPEEYFSTCDGRVIKSVNDLYNLLKVMDLNIFNHHVTLYKNDFSKWIYESIGDTVLAEDIANIKDREEMVRVIENRMLELWFKTNILSNNYYDLFKKRIFSTVLEFKRIAYDNEDILKNNSVGTNFFDKTDAGINNNSMGRKTDFIPEVKKDVSIPDFLKTNSNSTNDKIDDFPLELPQVDVPGEDIDVNAPAIPFEEPGGEPELLDQDPFKEDSPATTSTNIEMSPEEPGAGIDLLEPDLPSQDESVNQLDETGLEPSFDLPSEEDSILPPDIPGEEEKKQDSNDTTGKTEVK